MGSLKALTVRNAAPGRHSDGDGLMLIVKPNGRRYWVLRVMKDGQRRDLGLGTAEAVSLATARLESAKLRAAVKAGDDPVARKREAIVSRKAERAIAGERTFRAVTERFLVGHIPTLKNPKHAALWRSTFETYAFPALGNKPIQAITGPMVLDALDGVWSRAPETARRVRQRIGAVLDFAHARGWRDAKPDLAALTAHAMPKHAGTVRHHAAVAYIDATSVVGTLRTASESHGRLALLFTIFTVARSGETRGATWDEIDLDAALWTVPGERMKAVKAHTVPLNEPALAILRRLEGARLTSEPGELVFAGSGGRPLSDMTMAKAQRLAAPETTVHGWRSTFRDWAGETTNFPADVCEAALAHAIGGKVQRAYQRGDLLAKRRELMNAWGDFLSDSKNLTRESKSR